MHGGWTSRTRLGKYLDRCLVVGLAAWLGLLGGVMAAARADVTDTTCLAPQRLFAVDAQSGHLDEIGFCAGTASLAPAVEVDVGDWRSYRELTAVRDGGAVVLYAITADDRLQLRRQAASGEPFGPPVDLASTIDWSQVTSMFAPHAGYLHVKIGPAMRTLRHEGLATGGTALTEIEPLLPAMDGPAMSAAQWGGRGEGNAAGKHFRVWRELNSLNPPGFQDRWLFSGLLPDGISGVAGAEPYLFGLDPAGAVALLLQPAQRPDPPRKYWDCALFNHLDWHVGATTSGHFGRLVVLSPRVYLAGSPSLGELRDNRGVDCGNNGLPYEWQ